MYKLNTEKMFFDVADGQAIVINFTTGMYYGTSTLGSAILDNLLKGVSPETILAAVKSAPGCPADFEKSLTNFINTLQEKEIILPAEGASSPAQLTADAYKDGFDLSVNEFAEVKDLLLADPVHDVDIDKGWPILEEK